MSSLKKNTSNKNVVVNCIFEFRYTPSDEISFTKSKHNKSLNKNTKIFFGIIPTPTALVRR